MEVAGWKCVYVDLDIFSSEFWITGLDGLVLGVFNSFADDIARDSRSGNRGKFECNW